MKVEILELKGRLAIVADHKLVFEDRDYLAPINKVLSPTRTVRDLDELESAVVTVIGNMCTGIARTHRGTSSIAILNAARIELLKWYHDHKTAIRKGQVYGPKFECGVISPVITLGEDLPELKLVTSVNPNVSITGTYVAEFNGGTLAYSTALSVLMLYAEKPNIVAYNKSYGIKNRIVSKGIYDGTVPFVQFAQRFVNSLEVA